MPVLSTTHVTTPCSCAVTATVGGTGRGKKTSPNTHGARSQCTLTPTVHSAAVAQQSIAMHASPLGLRTAIISPYRFVRTTWNRWRFCVRVTRLRGSAHQQASHKLNSTHVQPSTTDPYSTTTFMSSERVRMPSSSRLKPVIAVNALLQSSRRPEVEGHVDV